MKCSRSRVLIVMLILIFLLYQIYPKDRRKKSWSSMKGFLIDTEECKIPLLDPFDGDAKVTVNHFKFLSDQYRSCEDGVKHYTTLAFNKATGIYNLSKNVRKSGLTCQYQEIIRENDWYSSYGESVLIDSWIIVPEAVENIYVECLTANRTEYENVYYMIRDKRKTKVKIKNAVSVLIIGIDSLSRSAMIRTMPKTWSYLDARKGWFHLPGYNRVEDATYRNLLPLLTGLKAMNDNYPCRAKEFGGLDTCPFIWRKFKDLGYVTAYVEDFTEYSTFNYLKKGFDAPPTDHYIRHLLAEVRKIWHYDPICRGSKYEAEYVFDFMMDFVEFYKGSPFFGLFWTNTFTHQNPELSLKMDEKIEKYLKKLEAMGTLDESVVILVSDHGERIREAPRTLVGHMEENLPAFFISLPPSLTTKEVRSSLETNMNRLVSPFDIYKTLLEIIQQDFRSKGCPKCQSIFKPIPSKRKCGQAGIKPAYCSCLDNKEISIDSERTQSMAKIVVEFMNDFKNTFQNGIFSKVCRNLTLDVIKSSFVFGKDEVFFVSFSTNPNGGVFEAMVPSDHYNNDDKSIRITRTDSYENDSFCMDERELKDICFCS